MEIEFLPAKNGEITARFNSLFLHSAYSPDNEAKRFIENLSIPYSPECIICCEPGLSYILPYLHEKYPECKIGVIRFSKDFNEYNSGFDYIFKAYDTNFENNLFNELGEEKLCSTYFLSWAPSAKAFSEINSQVWNTIKNVSEKAKMLLVTRQFFEKKWFLNSCKNLSSINNYYSLNKKIDKPILIIASGPSLESKLETIKENQNKFFIICLSSAIQSVLQNNIVPDLCFSTDGGYWAGEHLKKLKQQKLPLALSIEAYCQSHILKSNPIILMKYGDGLSNTLVCKTKLSLPLANRNGTVSGTALDFSLFNSTGPIYFCGLDLANNKGFQHTQPNELELNSNYKDNFISSKEKRLSSGTFNSKSLEIYKEWFQNKNLNGKKVYRVIEDCEKQNTLGQIEDISLENFKIKIKNYEANNNDFYYYFKQESLKINNQDLKKIIFELLDSKETEKFLFPLDYVSIGHNTENKDLLQNRIYKEITKLKNKIEKQFK